MLGVKRIRRSFKVFHGNRAKTEEKIVVFKQLVQDIQLEQIVSLDETGFAMLETISMVYLVFCTRPVFIAQQRLVDKRMANQFAGSKDRKNTMLHQHVHDLLVPVPETHLFFLKE